MVKAGLVETSLREGLESVGLHGGLSGAFVEAFEGRINFGTDTRKGDVFRIIVDEEKVRGEFYRYGRIHALDYHSARRGKFRAYYHAIPGEAGQFYDSTGRAMHGGWLRTPLRYDRISSRFNPRRRHPILKRIVPHTGVDYAASLGTPVWAAANGIVKFAGRKGANGNLVSIRHQGGFESHYAHLHRIQSDIKKGVRVKQRQSLGVVGSTGRSTGPHLHFALKKGGRFVDPQKELNGRGLRMGRKQNAIFKKKTAPIAIELDALEANGPQPVEPPTDTDTPRPEIDEAMD